MSKTLELMTVSEYLKSAVEIPGTRVWRDPTIGKVYQGALGDRSYAGQILDISAITAKVVMDEVLGLARPDYVLRGLCRPARLNQLVGTTTIATKLAALKKWPAMVEPDIKKLGFATVEFRLWKNEVLVAASDEEQMMASIDIMRSHTLDASGALAAAENEQVAEIAETGTEIAGTDWGDDTKNPYDDIGKVIDAIGPKGYNIDAIAANPLVWGDFFSNDHVKGSAVGVRLPAGKTFDVPGLPGVAGFSDFSLTSTKAVVLSIRGPALFFGEGPTTSARFRNELAGYDAYIIRQWLQPKLVLSDAIRVLTGVHA